MIFLILFYAIGKFTASDGTQFEDRSAWRKYEFETNYTFRNRKGETLLKYPGAIQGYLLLIILFILPSLNISQIILTIYHA
jgi:hypothetical protein